MFKKLWFWNKPVLATSSPYIEAVDRLKQISSPGAGVYADLRRIEVLFPTIDIYIEVIQRAIAVLQEKKIFSFIGYEPKLQLIAKRYFYQSKEDKLLPIDVWHERFIRLATELILLYEQQEPPETTAEQTSHQRILLIVNNLMNFNKENIVK